MLQYVTAETLTMNPVTPETLTIIPTCPNTGPAFRGQNQDRRLKWPSRPKNNKTVPLTVPTEKPHDCPSDLLNLARLSVCEAWMRESRPWRPS